jgi:hypothetical protein
MIIPKDVSKKGVVIEFKTSRGGEENELEEKAKQALEQIETMDYANELAANGIKEAMELAIVFHGKNVHIEYRIKKLK